jgi:hypothetical protein
MLKIVAATLAVASLLAGSAAAAEPALQVSYPTDATMDCPSLATELARMDAVAAQANQKIASANGAAQGANLGATVAVEGMLRTGVLGRVPGAGMFANGAANMAKQRAAAVAAQSAETIRTAETRKAMLGGMYMGKGCDAPQAAPAAPAPAAPAAS